MKFLLPQGIGDSIWGLFKVQAIAKAHNDPIIDLYIACYHANFEESRALEFLKRFTFVNSVQMMQIDRSMAGDGPVLRHNEPIAMSNGYYNYIPDGPNVIPGIDYVLIANTPLERGIRLEDWLPQYETRWDIINDFHFKPEELNYAGEFYKKHGDFVTFFMGSVSGNGVAGHNRNGVWRPQDWVELGTKIIEKYNVKIVVVGALYDKDYFIKQVKPLIKRHQNKWVDEIAQHEIAQSYAIIKRSKFLISYQSGIAIVGTYFGIPTAVFWRAKGDSISPNHYISFEESMASAWTPPDIGSKHMPLIYGRHDVNYILSQVETRGW